MGNNKKKKKLNEGTPFDELEKSIHLDSDPVDLNSMVRRFDSIRDSDRESIRGHAVIYDLTEQLIVKGKFRNLSPTGVCFEISPVDLQAADHVFVDFNAGLNLGMVLCEVQWVREIEGHRDQNKIVGLKFKRLTVLKQKQLHEFLIKVRQLRNHDPFVGS